jgi:hypothetical protein
MPTVTKSGGPQELQHYDVTIDAENIPADVPTSFQVVYLDGEFKEVLTTIPQTFFGTRDFFRYAARIDDAIKQIEDL